MSVITEELRQSWTQVGPLLEIRNEHDYDAAIERLNVLIDEVGTDEGHPLYSLLDTLGTVIHAWEEQHHPIPAVSGADAGAPWRRTGLPGSPAGCSSGPRLPAGCGTTRAPAR